MKLPATYQKLRGGYYTPAPIADFLARWAIQSPAAQVLEPSCGDGAVLEAAAAALLRYGVPPADIAAQLHGIELDPDEAQKAAARTEVITGGIAVPVHIGDFFAYCKAHLTDKRLFDAIIGNPPFIRYQDFAEEQRQIAFYLMQSGGLHPNRLTNAWVPFLVAATMLLNEHGRMAMVIPAELLQVNYAAELRYFLSRYYSSLTLITFKKLVFAGIQQEVVLLLGERGRSEHAGIRVAELENLDDLARYEHSVLMDRRVKEMDHSTQKWTMYFLDEDEIALLRRLRDDPRLTPSGHAISVDVGIVTGMNEFFVLNEQQVNEHRLTDYTRRIVGRSAQLPGIQFGEADWLASVQSQAPAFLLDSPDVSFDRLPDAVRSYVSQGQEQGLHTGYKCRIRNRWYVVPSVWEPSAFMLRQIHNYPKIILNHAAATSTDTIHRVRLRNGIPAPTIATAFLNSLTFAFAEVIGRSYGGGVLELEPNEAEQLPLPLKGAAALNLDELDLLMRQGDINAVLDITDTVLLRDGLGMSEKETRMLRGIWQKLRDRRVNRKHNSLERR